MFVDARSVAAGTVVESDLCIVGAGAAGITLAREFLDAGLRVSVVESGALDFAADTQELYSGQSVGLRSVGYNDLGYGPRTTPQGCPNLDGRQNPKGVETETSTDRTA